MGLGGVVVRAFLIYGIYGFIFLAAGAAFLGVVWLIFWRFWIWAGMLGGCGCRLLGRMGGGNWLRRLIFLIL